MTSININDILNKNNGSMTRSQLVAHLRGVGVGIINKKLKDLVKEGSIKLSGNTIISIPTYKVDQTLRPGIEDENGNIEQTGHIRVSIPYDRTLFRVVDDSGKLLENIVVDEGIANLLNAVWRHGILTTYSCQGGDGKKAWIRFQWRKDVSHFNDLIGHISRISGRIEWILNEVSLEIFFPPEHIAMMTEELNSKPIR